MLLMVIIFLTFSLSIFGKTNLGTINTIRNGFATIKECRASAMDICLEAPLDSIKDILNFTTSNQCLASEMSFGKMNMAIAKCPQSDDQVRGLDNTYPSAGVFALYTGYNNNLIHDLASSYLTGPGSGRFNLVIPRDRIDLLKSNPDLIRVLNSKRVNIIDVATMPTVDLWMQDAFQFTTVNGEMAIFQLEQSREEGTFLDKRFACQIARKCNIPYYIPPDMVDLKNRDDSALNSGGNLEILPGGTFYTGIIKTKGFGNNLPSPTKLPYRTAFQKRQKSALQSSGNRVLELDVSFLRVGHIDEIFSVVKTNRPRPCDYAVLMADPQKAFDLMELAARDQETWSVHTGSPPPVKQGKKKFFSPQYCESNSYEVLKSKGKKSIIDKKDIQNVYDNYCIDGETVESFVASDEFAILKRENLKQKDPPNIAEIMHKNRAAVIAELIATTKCKSPQIIELPVFFRNGLSYTPNLINGVVETPPGSPSRVILPRTYFKPFDDYVKTELKKYELNTAFVHDMNYHLKKGEIHCGTNTARICRLK